ncbi:MAG: energy transducer TonB [Terracidiphilus sp.]
MAPPTKITEETEPEVLPADFGEWDSGAPPTTLPDNFNDFDAGPKHPAPAQVAAPPPAVREPEPPPVRRRTPAYVEPEEVPEPPRQKRAKVAPAPKPRIEPEPEPEIEDEGEGKGKGKVVIIAIAAVLLLGAGGYFAMNYQKFVPGKPAATQQAVVQQPDSSSLTPANKPKPGPATPTTTAPTTATPTPAEAAEQDQQQTPAPAQSAAMQQQLNATSKLAGNLKAAPDNSVAPSSGISLDMGNAGGTPNVFGSKPGPKVTAAAQPSTKMISVAASIMAGRAISRTPPAYPAFARTARVDGTVALHATISKAGTIENVSVISGPSMLRQAAIDAVKTWRYKPYLLDNEPVEVETTVNVVFVLQ